MQSRPIRIALFLLVCSGYVFAQQIPSIGDVVDPKWPPRKQNVLCLSALSQMDPCFKRSINGVKFTIAYRAETKRVSYVHTTDQKFKTVDGLKIGDEITFLESTLRRFPAWETQAPITRDGWYPVIGPILKFENGRLQVQEPSVDDRSGFFKSGKAKILAFTRMSD